ncbi:MAG: hypothetical protein P4L99_08980 [Chthoniobacter sp.]|nr:hypothetical protein [Chthoniobacter sp.]
MAIEDVHYPASEIMLYKEIADDDGKPIHYHLFCASREESLKLSRCFHADGFVKIRGKDEFFGLVSSELKRKYPASEFFAGDVRYYDDREHPCLKQLDEMILHKTVEFMYQRETRFVILNGPQPGERFEVEIEPPEGLFELQSA